MSPADHARRLAIVIPAWRARHFPAALDSLRNQTDRRFRLYIGDDGSPDDLCSIVDAHTAGLDIVYHRFPENLGGTDLVAHWHRCIALTRDEPWIWLFSDDDIAGPDCVAAFHRQADAGFDGATLLRFGMHIIDEHDGIVRTPAPHPARETALDCLAAMWSNCTRNWCAPDHIFPRSSYDRAGGFINYPKALYSDLATWVLFASYGHVRTLPGPGIRFRSHPQGTSSGMMALHRKELLLSLVRFCQFGLDLCRRTDASRLKALRRSSKGFFNTTLRNMHQAEADAVAMIRRCREIARTADFPCSFRLRLYALRLSVRNAPGIRSYSKWRYNRTLAGAASRG